MKNEKNENGNKPRESLEKERFMFIILIMSLLTATMINKESGTLEWLTLSSVLLASFIYVLIFAREESIIKSKSHMQFLLEFLILVNAETFFLGTALSKAGVIEEKPWMALIFGSIIMLGIIYFVLYTLRSSPKGEEDELE